ncbi:MAG: hypothetical protein M1813_000994 [Trichoglossum hirsutum]|nr:MAG: hypothetical protein M1813_000994 [Trichoglossum hirsutum]
MTLHLSSKLTLLLTFYILNPHSAGGQSTVSITSFGAYRSQPSCVQNCIWNVSVDDDLIAFISCTSPWQNDCYCRTASASSASSFLSSCVIKSCSTMPPESSPAIAVYNDYCTQTTGQDVSIVSYTAYQSLPSCVRNCVWHPATGDDLVPFLGCTSPWKNSCYCQTASASSASSFLSSCVVSKCAITVYQDYCTTAGAQAIGLTTAATLLPTSTSSPEPTSALPISTSPPRSTGTGGGLSLSDKIALGVGLPSSICAVLALCLSLWLCARKKSNGKVIPVKESLGEIGRSLTLRRHYSQRG